MLNSFKPGSYCVTLAVHNRVMRNATQQSLPPRNPWPQPWRGCGSGTAGAPHKEALAGPCTAWVFCLYTFPVS